MGASVQDSMAVEAGNGARRPWTLRRVVTAGVPFDTPGTTNLLKVEVV